MIHSLWWMLVPKACQIEEVKIKREDVLKNRKAAAKIKVTGFLYFHTQTRKIRKNRRCFSSIPRTKGQMNRARIFDQQDPVTQNTQGREKK